MLTDSFVYTESLLLRKFRGPHRLYKKSREEKVNLVAAKRCQVRPAAINRAGVCRRRAVFNNCSRRRADGRWRDSACPRRPGSRRRCPTE